MKKQRKPKKNLRNALAGVFKRFKRFNRFKRFKSLDSLIPSPEGSGSGATWRPGHPASYLSLSQLLLAGCLLSCWLLCNQSSSLSLSLSQLQAGWQAGWMAEVPDYENQRKLKENMCFGKPYYEQSKKTKGKPLISGARIWKNKENQRKTNDFRIQARKNQRKP